MSYFKLKINCINFFRLIASWRNDLINVASVNGILVARLKREKTKKDTRDRVLAAANTRQIEEENDG
tara:strand:+ start:262 stop:462 length:201 start_codon:yes stop_codon:yes gene_type:complete